MRAAVVVVGAGQAGLAMSHHLTSSGIDHVVLERGEVASSWRTERWDSLRLLTPNWMSRLPGWSYAGSDPDGFMSAAETAAFIAGYAQSFAAPVTTGVTVQAVRPSAHGFVVLTDAGTWECDAVVAASGACSDPRVPAVAAELPGGIQQLSALRYRNPGQVTDGEVLVVGGSASGAQIADELQRSGRSVTLAVGEHVRLPRTYRGRDIHAWMDAIGQLDERHDEVDDINRARRVSSLQLIGTPERRTLDLNALMTSGVRVVGRLMRIAGARAQFSGALANLVKNADLKQDRLLDRIDEFVRDGGLPDGFGPVDTTGWTRPPPTALGPISTDLPISAFRSVIWATGYAPRFPWLDPAALDRRGRVVHDGGVAPLAGLYYLGLPFMRRRKSSFIDGVGPDAAELLLHIRAHLDRVRS
jgi:putative flavoprotein involved in K+ transport